MSLGGQNEGHDYRPPPHQVGVWTVLGVAFVLVLGLFSVRFAYRPDTTRAYASRLLPPEPAPVLREEPKMDDTYWPCSDCHDQEITNPKVRVLEDDHEARSAEFKHGNLWCLHCHDLKDRDKLHLADGQLVDFDHTWQLCTQCHAQKLLEWRAGVHGKRTGHWWGAKEYLSCIECHNPHVIVPAFKPIDPKPRPLRPTEITVQGNLKREEVSQDEHG